jgi:hypothetical protein
VFQKFGNKFRYFHQHFIEFSLILKETIPVHTVVYFSKTCYNKTIDILRKKQ